MRLRDAASADDAAIIAEWRGCALGGLRGGDGRHPPCCSDLQLVGVITAAGDILNRLSGQTPRGLLKRGKEGLGELVDRGLQFVRSRIPVVGRPAYCGRQRELSAIGIGARRDLRVEGAAGLGECGAGGCLCRRDGVLEGLELVQGREPV